MSVNKILKKPIIGIIGGAGPEASIDFQLKLFDLMNSKLDIFSDKDYLRVITDNNTDLINRDYQFFSGNDDLLTKQLLQSLQVLESAGVSIAAIICNSIHIYFDKIQSLTSIKLIHIVHVVGEYLRKHNINKVGLLCTLSIYESNLYKDVLQKYGVEIIIPDRKNQIKISQVIYSIKTRLFKLHNDLSSKEYTYLSKVYKYNLSPLITELEYNNLSLAEPKQLLSDAIKSLEEKNEVEYFVLGCTELPLIYDWYKGFISKFIDPNFLLAEALIDNALI